jgi:hypothetical protein
LPAEVQASFSGLLIETLPANHGNTSAIYGAERGATSVPLDLWLPWTILRESNAFIFPQNSRWKWIIEAPGPSVVKSHRGARQ